MPANHEHHTEEDTATDVLDINPGMEDVLDIIDPDDGLVDDFDKELMAETEKPSTPVARNNYVKPVARQPAPRVEKRDTETKRKMEEQQVG